jgi:tol-pal system protein YbgF
MQIVTSILRTGALVLCITCSACLHIQQQLDEQSREIESIRTQLARLQATSNNDIEQLRSDMQALNGSFEESSLIHTRELESLQNQISSIAAMVKSHAAATVESRAPAPVTQTGSVDTEQASYEQALQLYKARDYIQSRASFETFLKKYPDSRLTDNAFFWIGMCLFQQKDYRGCIATFEDLIKKFPQGSKTADALYWQAMAFIEMKESLTAQLLLETLMQSYPGSEAAQRAQAKHNEITGNQ